MKVAVSRKSQKCMQAADLLLLNGDRQGATFPASWLPESTGEQLEKLWGGPCIFWRWTRGLESR